MQQLELFSAALANVDDIADADARRDEIRRRIRLGICLVCGDDMHNDLDWLAWGEMGYGWCRACSAAVGVEVAP